jgi:large subunit ribosomal protein L3
MGNSRFTVRNLQVVSADLDRNLLFVKGSVPGAHNSLVIIRKSEWRQRSE